MYTYQAIHIEPFEQSLTRLQVMLDAGWEPLREIAYYNNSAPAVILCILRKPIPGDRLNVSELVSIGDEIGTSRRR